MKKRIMLGVMGFILIFFFVACEKKDSKYIPNVKYKKYIEICEYKGIKARKVVFEIPDEKIKSYIKEEMYEHTTYETVKDRGIELGDYVNIDYKATMDGKPFEDFSGEDEDVLVGEGFVHAGIENALLGMKVGESKSTEIELMQVEGRKQIFVDIKVNSITNENAIEYNDEYVKEYTEFETKKEYEDFVRKILEETKEDEYRYVTVEDLMAYLIENSKFDGSSKKIYRQCKKNYDKENEYYASIMGMSLDEYMKEYGIDEKTKDQNIETAVKERLIIGTIAKNENITATDEEINSFAVQAYPEYGYNSAEEFIKEYSKDEIGYKVIYEKVMDFVCDHAILKEISEEDYLKEYEEAEKEIYLEEGVENEIRLEGEEEIDLEEGTDKTTDSEGATGEEIKVEEEIEGESNIEEETKVEEQSEEDMNGQG